MFTRSPAMLVMVVLLTSAQAQFAFAEPDNIDRALAAVAPKLMSGLKNSGYRAVGVLPFRVQVGEERPRLGGSMMGTNLASRLERALAAFYDPDQPVAVVFDALDQAQRRDPGATFVHAAGRRKLFGYEYRLPIDADPVKVDAFLMGKIQTSPDWRRTQIHFELVERPDSVIRKGSVEVATDRQMLAHIGRGFSLSRYGLVARGIPSTDIIEGVVKDDSWQLTLDADLGVESPSDRIGKPLPSHQDPWAALPVRMTVRYDDQPQTLTQDSLGSPNNFAVQDPSAGQRVTFDLENTSDDKIAVVLAVNGINTLYGEPISDIDATPRWVLEPRKLYRVQGIYDRDHKTFTPVKGLNESAAQKQIKAIPAGSAGLINLYVFRQSAANLTGTRPSGVGAGATKTGGASSTGAGSVGSIRQAGDENRDKVPSNRRVETLEDGGDLTGFTFGIASRSGEAEQRVARGSFHPTASNSQAADWNALRAAIARGVIDPSSGRALMGPDGAKERQNLTTDRLDSVQMTDVIQIRYFSATQGL